MAQAIGMFKAGYTVRREDNHHPMHEGLLRQVAV